MKTDNRPQAKTLTPDLLDLFYRILIFCESDAIDTKEFKITAPRLKEFLIDKSDKRKNSKITLNYNSKYKKNKVDFNEKLSLNEIRFNNSKNNVIKSLLWHLRHAFAHNRLFFRHNNHRILYIENVYKGNINMKANIKVSILKKFINSILEN